MNVTIPYEFSLPVDSDKSLISWCAVAIGIIVSVKYEKCSHVLNRYSYHPTIVFKMHKMKLINLLFYEFKIIELLLIKFKCTDLLYHFTVVLPFWNHEFEVRVIVKNHDEWHDFLWLFKYSMRVCWFGAILLS